MSVGRETERERERGGVLDPLVVVVGGVRLDSPRKQGKSWS